MTSLFGDKLQGLLGQLSFAREVVAGLDIGDSAVKMAQLGKKGSQIVLEQFGYSPLPEGTFIDDELVQKDRLLVGIKNALDAGVIRTKKFAYGFPGQSCVIKKMSAPRGSKQEIEDHITWEADQFVPFGAENSIISIHHPQEQVGGSKKNKKSSEDETKAQVKKSKLGDDDKVDVLMVAAKKDQVEQSEDLMKEVGLHLKIIDLQPLALLNALFFNYEDQMEEIERGSLVIDFGAHYTKVILYKEGFPIFMKALPIGGSMITEEIQKKVGLTFEEAEDLKLMRDDQGHLPEEIAQIVRQMSDKIIQTVKDSCNFFLQPTSQDRAYQCFITGGNAQLPGLQEDLPGQLGLPVELIDPFRNIKVANKKYTPEIIEQMTYIGVVAIGLGLRALI